MNSLIYKSQIAYRQNMTKRSQIENRRKNNERFKLVEILVNETINNFANVYRPPIIYFDIIFYLFIYLIIIK